MNDYRYWTKHYLLTYTFQELSQSPKRFFMVTIKMIQLWAQKSKQRRALSRLTDRQLSDLGISRSDANKEAAKVFWK